MRKFEVVRDDMRRTNGEIKLPTRATKYSVGYDIYSPINITIPPMQSKLIWTDVKAKFNPEEALLLNVRSNMGKYKIMLANTQGWIESDYYDNEETGGNIGINLFNLGEKDYVIKKGDRIAQCMLIPHLTFENGNTDKKRTGGFGHSGK